MTITPETLRKEAERAAAVPLTRDYDRAHRDGYCAALRDTARRMEEEAAAREAEADPIISLSLHERRT